MSHTVTSSVQRSKRHASYLVAFVHFDPGPAIAVSPSGVKIVNSLGPTLSRLHQLKNSHQRMEEAAISEDARDESCKIRESCSSGAFRDITPGCTVGDTNQGEE
jgi:hypothetical protein